MFVYSFIIVCSFLFLCRACRQLAHAKIHFTGVHQAAEKFSHFHADHLLSFCYYHTGKDEKMLESDFMNIAHKYVENYVQYHYIFERIFNNMSIK